MQRASGNRKVADSQTIGCRIVAFRPGRLFAFTLKETDVRKPRIPALLMGLSLFGLSSSAFAQSKMEQASSDTTSGSSASDWSSPWEKADRQIQSNKRHLGIGLNTSGFIVPSRWEIANGGMVAMDVVWRLQWQRRSRFEVGVLGRFSGTRDAVLVGAGVPFRLVLGVNELVETDLAVELSYARILFAQPFFAPRNAFISTIRWEVGFLLDPKLTVGLTPIGLSFVAGDKVNLFGTYEPGIWVRFSPI
jgi:hypothetical protein